jgi:serine/threonine protein kinase/tetratricopeptide (TPR) repeat protein
MPLPQGTRIGPYEILSELGAGGMGEVYRAHDVRLDRDVAVKVLPERFSADRERLTRFEQEARAAAALSHPNILAVYDVGTSGHISYVVTELLEGDTLRDSLRRGRLDQDRAVRIAIEILSGLSVAHERGIIHRDLKPDNIFLTRSGQTKILDFGIAKVAHAQIHEPDAATGTVPGIILGTIGYMSPEQVRGAATDARADIFSVGVVLYECLTGRRAFKDDSDVGTLSAILEKDPLPLGSCGVDAPTALIRIVNRCLQKDPVARFQTASDFKFALESLGEPGYAPRATAPKKSIAVLPFVNMSGTSDQDYFSDGLAEEVINALAHLPELRVASRSSAFRFRGHDKDVRDIGRQLSVDTVLEGSVRRAGNRLRVTVQLINVSDGYHLWSERYDRELSDVFAIQDEITQSIVNTLEPKLLGRGQPVTRRHSESVEAFELCLRGRHFWYQRTESSLRAGINCFSKAVELDPTYALAHAGLADSFSVMRPWGYVSADEARERTETAARRALELEPMLAEAHFSMALYRFWLTDDWPDAEPHFERAIELNPRSSMMLVYFADFLSLRHRFDDAARYLERALDIDRLSPFTCGLGALALYQCRRYDAAVDLAERALSLHPEFALGLYALGVVEGQLGRYDRSIDALSRLLAATSRASVVIGMLGYAYALAGRTHEAQLLLDELRDRAVRQYVDPIAASLVYVGLGDLDNVERQLKLTIDVHAAFPNVEHLLGERLDGLATEARFRDLFRRLRLAPRVNASNDSEPKP